MSNRNLNYNITLPSFTASNLVTTNATISNLSCTSSTISNLSVSNINLGNASVFSGACIANNNVVSAIDVNGLNFTNANIRSFTATINVTIIGGTSLYAVYNIIGSQNASGWGIYSESLGDTTGIIFSITSSGQVQYTSTNVSNFTSSTFRYSVTQYSQDGTYNSLLSSTGGSIILDTLQINNTTDSVPGSSNGGLYVLGGATVSKRFNATTSISSASIFANNSTMTNIVATAISTGSIVASTIVGSTRVTTASIFANSGTLGNIVNTTTSTGTISASSYTGGNMSLSGNANVGGTLNIVNLTTTNIVNTNVSAGTLRVGGTTITNNFVGTGTSNTLGCLITNTNGSVSINVTSPGNNHRLYTSGRIHVGDTSFVDTGGYGYFQTTSSAAQLDTFWQMSLIRSGVWSWGMGQRSDGAFYVWGGSAPGVYLSISATSWSSNSDRRLKKNIKNLEYGLSEIMSLKPKRFDYNTDTTNDSSKLGFIAQDVLPIVKEVVNGSDDTTYGLCTTDLVPVLVNAIKELKVIISNQVSEIKLLQ